MTRKKVDFVLSTGTTCFLCYEEIVNGSVKVNCPSPTSPPSSFKNLCRHLEVNLGETISVPDKFLGILERLDVQVSLCQDCERENEQFSNLYRELEVVRIKLGLCLETILGKMRGSGKRSERVKEYPRKLEGDPKAKLHAGMVEKLRGEVMLKCQSSFKRDQPRVRIQRMSRKQPGYGKKPNPPGPSQIKSGSAGPGDEDEDDQLHSESIVVTPDMDYVHSHSNDTKKGPTFNSSREDRLSCRFCRRSFTKISNKHRHERDLTGRCAKTQAGAVVGTLKTKPYVRQRPEIQKRLTLKNEGQAQKLEAEAGHSGNIAWQMERKVEQGIVFACHNCKLRFSTRATRNRHVRKGICTRKKGIGTGFVGPSSAVPRGPAKKEDNVQPDPSKPYVCNSCPGSFSSRLALSCHFMRVHLDGKRRRVSKNRQFACDLCPKSFAWGQSLKVHRQSVHFGAQFTCRNCSRVYSRFSSLFTHQKLHCKGQKRGAEAGSLPASPDPVSKKAPEQGEIQPGGNAKLNAGLGTDGVDVDIKREAMEPEPDLNKEHDRVGRGFQDDLAQLDDFNLDPLDDVA